MSLVALTAAGALAFAVQTGQPPALPAQDTADLQCLAVSMVMNGLSEDDTMRSALMAASMFYLGRLEGRTPGVDWLDRMTVYLRSATPEQLQGQTQRCGAEIGQMGGRVQAWSARVASEEATATPASTPAN